MKLDITYNFEQLLPLVIRVVKSKRTPFIWGPPGIGKSALGREVAKELGAELYILDAPLLQPIDYCVAVPDHNTKTVQLYPTGFLPLKGPAVVLIEDLPHAKPYQMVPLMQIVLDRRIGPVKFADDIYFIITGNREEDLANTNPIPSPFLNRVVHFDMAPDLEGWIRWAKSEDLDERIYAFLNANQQFFIELPKDGVKAWPTPRSWHMLSDVIKGLKDDEIFPYALASVGPAANQFSAWLKYLREIDINAIIDRGEIPHIQDRAKLFTVVQAVAHNVVNRVKSKGMKALAPVMENVLNYWRSLTDEYKILFLKELIVYKKKAVDVSIVEKLAEKEPAIYNLIKGVIG